MKRQWIVLLAALVLVLGGCSDDKKPEYDAGPATSASILA